MIWLGVLFLSLGTCAFEVSADVVDCELSVQGMRFDNHLGGAREEGHVLKAKAKFISADL